MSPQTTNRMTDHPPPCSLLYLPTHSDLFQPLAHTDKFVTVILTFQLSSYTIIVSQSTPQPNPTSLAPPPQAVLRCGHNRLPNASVPVCFTFMLLSRESVLRARLFVNVTPRLSYIVLMSWGILRQCNLQCAAAAAATTAPYSLLLFLQLQF